MLALVTVSLSLTFDLREERIARVSGGTSTGTGTAFDEIQQTFYSDAINLKAGHMIFTFPRDTPLPMPSGTFAITGIVGDIVYADTHKPAPLSTLYDHHWTIKSSNHRNALCKGGLEYIFGIGAESRNSPVNFPVGYGYVVSEGTRWGANIHLLRTEGLSGSNPFQAAKECNECYFAESKGGACTPEQNGTFACCGENDSAGVMSCPTIPNPPPPRSYRLRYTMSFTTNVSAITPVHIGTMSAPNCATFYSALRDDVNPVHHVSYSIRIAARLDLLFAVGHLHTGGLNITLSKNGQLLCTSLPTYGTQPGVPGDEKGYLVRMSPCLEGGSGPVELYRGDVVSIDGYYYVGSNDTRLLYSDGTHLNVMAYMYTVYTRPPASVDNDEDAEFWQHTQAAPLLPGQLPEGW